MRAWVGIAIGLMCAPAIAQQAPVDWSKPVIMDAPLKAQPAVTEYLLVEVTPLADAVKDQKELPSQFKPEPKVVGGEVSTQTERERMFNSQAPRGTQAPERTWKPDGD